MPQRNGRQISTIDQWTSAFLVFGAVYTQRFPEVAPGMFKYCEVVRDIVQTNEFTIVHYETLEHVN